jgi:hypothetical protein
MATAEQRARAEVYRDAAAEHVTAAGELYDLGRYVQSNYLAGLAVECMLRAYRIMIDPEFDSRHDIDRLYELAKFADVVPPGNAEATGLLLSVVVALWSNDHRFLSEAALRRRWTRRRLYEGIKKGDFVKERNRQLVNAASGIVTVGVARWTTSFKN